MNRELSFYNYLGQKDGMQIIVDTVNERYNNTNWKRDFAWARPQWDLTFSVLAAEIGITPMAAVIDVNAPKPLRNVRGASFYGGSIPKLGHGFNVDEQDMRNQQILAARGGDVDIAAISDIFFKNVDKLVGGAHARLNEMADQARSTGKIVVNITNNPDGVVSFVDVDLKVPAANKLKAGFNQTVPAAWSDLTDSDPVQDLIDMVAYADENFIPYGVIEMAKSKFNALVSHPKVMAFVRARMDVGATYPVNRGDVLSALASFLPPIVICDAKFAVEVDGQAQSVTGGFDADNVILRPAAILGEVKNAMSVHTLAPSTAETVRTTAEEGRFALLSTWKATELINHVELEALAIPTLSNPKALVILDTATAFS